MEAPSTPDEFLPTQKKKDFLIMFVLIKTIQYDRTEL